MNKLEFEHQQLWTDFQWYLQRTNRYVLDKRLERFIKVLRQTAKKRKDTIYQDQIFFRGRIGKGERKKRGSTLFTDSAPLPKKELLNPPLNKAKSGRINPKGFSYLYLSSTVKTAIAETRPFIDEHVTVAICKIKTKINVLNIISKDDWLKICLPWDKKQSAEEKERHIWYYIDQDFSKPVADRDGSNDYIPTQYLSEVFRNEGYEGIIYGSSLSEDGHNLVIFNSDKVEIIKRELFKVTHLQYEFKKHKK